MRSDKHRRSKGISDVTRRRVSRTQRPAQEKKGKAPIGPLMIGFFLFVVVGSSVLQIVQMAGMGGRIAQQMENQQPRAEPQPRPQEEADARGDPDFRTE